jgi:hypothetical protein
MRSILGVFIVAWLNFVLQPCAMAIGNMEEHDCPRCPPSHEEMRADHAMHGRHLAAEETAPHEMPCANTATDCSLLDELNYDGRIVKLELDNAPVDTPIAVAPALISEPHLQHADCHSWHPARSPPPRSSVPLNVYYCVYLK